MSSPITRIIEPRSRDLGDGFKVRRVLPFHAQRTVGPFVFFDHFGPVEYAPGEGFDVNPHPHIGLSTVTYLFEGAIRHQDSLGSDLVIRPGAMNWMTAGHGIVHSEHTPDELRAQGQSLHGLQTWVALPDEDEDCEPSFEHHPADSLPEIDITGARIRVLAGEAWGKASPVKFPSPILYIALESKGGAELTLSSDLAEERALYLVSGSADVAGEFVDAGVMLVFESAVDVPVQLSPGTKGVICGGAKLPGKKRIEWNLVSGSQEKINQAKIDWTAALQAGGNTRFPAVPGDENPWIPLPSQ
ncbi:MAG: pirin family protein [Alphaproteobacteria bacterium]|nr:pirin family protein [Alphaproteobacteria bacterium]|tara:strand:- start:11081 stop:11983 length:903 start_codon:yes stop_codon:yes gene_type:complete